MEQMKRCSVCGEVKLYDCEQCYGVDTTEEISVPCLGECSKEKKND